MLQQLWWLMNSIVALNACGILHASLLTWPRPKQSVGNSGASCCLLISTKAPTNTNKTKVHITSPSWWDLFSNGPIWRWIKFILSCKVLVGGKLHSLFQIYLTRRLCMRMLQETIFLTFSPPTLKIVEVVLPLLNKKWSFFKYLCSCSEFVKSILEIFLQYIATPEIHDTYGGFWMLYTIQEAWILPTSNYMRVWRHFTTRNVSPPNTTTKP